MMTEGIMKRFWGFMNGVTNVFLERVKVVCMIVRRGSSEEVYDRPLIGILYDCVRRCLCM